MKRPIRYLAGAVATSVLLLGLGPGTAHALQEEPPGPAKDYSQVPQPAVPAPKTVAAGMRITFDDYVYFGNQCTLGAVGTDAAGRKVGITAGHCNPVPDKEWNPDNTQRLTDNTWKPIVGPAVNVHTTTNDYPVWDWRDVGAGPIGWIRYVSVDERPGREYPINKLDYMVIEFAPHVTLSSQVMTAPKYATRTNESGEQVLDYSQVVEPAKPWFTMNALYADAAGNPKLPPFGQTLCNAGAITNEGQVQGGTPTDLICGMVWSTADGVIRTSAGQLGGDSGGPAFIKGTGTKWAGIVSWWAPGANPVAQWAYTSAKKILDHLNSWRDANGNPMTGNGFTIFNG
ncbi:hypothetical protein FCG67_24545 [Rhodococcus oryzae]|uniref:Trypsin-like serine protease n=1 Tax=Rhodococcus oryzae TaxID=2571143 RepID=A0ABY2RFV6_9NOCA|nr:hypothetical protein [Rhodococcus oryzae]TJZ73375.1 hypothetical protein FCG67_24545 [Rhodococcus oryzae]